MWNADSSVLCYLAVLSFIVDRLLTAMNDVGNALIVSGIAVTRNLLRLPLVFVSLRQAPLTLTLSSVLYGNP